jgi:hypothetical protein
MSLGKYRISKLLALVAAALINPIAWPGWTIEIIARRWSPDWEFGVYTATPYFCALIFLATLGLLSGNPAAMAVGMYILTAMELLSSGHV